MNHYFLFFLFICNYAVLYGQPPGSPFNANDRLKGIIVGIVQDNEHGGIIEYANVALFEEEGSLIKGVVTNSEGRFQLKDLDFEKKYRIEVSYIGYEKFIREEISLTAAKPFFKLEVKLMQDAALLKEIEISGERSTVTASLQKKTYNLTKDLLSKGASISEVLENVPSVDVDIDGNVSLRGNNNVRILIDGESSIENSGDPALILKSIPADAIERIEVVTNPSAKFDPEGTSGIINIITKEEKRRGVNGTISGTIGTWNKYNLSTFVAYRNKKFSFSGNYGFKYDKSPNESTSLRNNFLNDSIRYLSQVEDGENGRMNNFARFGINYSLSQNNKIGISGLYNSFTFDRDLIRNSVITNASQENTSNTNRYSSRDGLGNWFQAAINFERSFSTKEENLIAKFSYSRFIGKFEGTFGDETLDSSGIIVDPVITNQMTLYKTKSPTYEVSLDYTKPFDSNKNLETGYKGQIKQTRGTYSGTVLNTVSNEFERDTIQDNDYEYDRITNAIYATYAQTINEKIGLEIGLRLEGTFTKGVLVTTGEDFTNDYFAFYPSFAFNAEVYNGHQVQLSYSRRVNRPYPWVLNPYIDYSDPLNVRKGNPFLEPEFINSFELGYNKIWDKANINSSVYYKLTTDVMERVQFVDSENDNVIVFSYDNLDKTHLVGYEFITKYDPFKWWSLNGDLNLFKTIIKGNIGESELNSENFSYRFKLSVIFNFWENAKLQFTGRYKSKEITAQGEKDPVGTLDIAFSKDILKERGTIGFRISDVFDTKDRENYTDTEAYFLDSYKKKQSRAFYLTFSYGFGSQGAMFNKRSNKKDDNEVDDDDGGF